MNKLLKFYRVLNVLSIDVALGAVCSSVWLADYFQVQLRIYAYLTLGITVWIIYTVDHLLDAKRIAHRAASKRHQFHQNNFRTLVVFVGLALLIDGVLVFFIRDSIFYAGLILSIIIGVYLLFNRWLSYLKEFFVAILYCGGVLLPVISIAGTEVLMQQAAIVVSFFFTVLINVILFSWFEWRTDKEDSSTSIAISAGIHRTKKLLVMLFIPQVVFTAFIGFNSFHAAIVLGLMNTVLLLIFLKPMVFIKDEMYRLVGDAIFFLPLLAFF